MFSRIDLSPIDWLALLPLLLAGGVVYWIGLVVSTAWRLLHPPRRTYAWAVARGVPGDPAELDSPLAFETVAVHSRGRDLAAWSIEGRDPDAPTAVLTHGWGSSRIGAIGRLPDLAAASSRVIAWDMPGHGESPGVCELAHGEIQDLVAVIQQLAPEGPLHLHGWSLGAEVSLRTVAQMADASRVVGMTVEAPYRRGLTPALNVMKQAELPTALNLRPALALIGLIWGGRPDRRFRDLAETVGSVECPVRVIHGSEDEISPPEDGRAIAAALPRGEFLLAEGAGHHDAWKTLQEGAS
ncbi:MAG: alpha/beta fold hydrolase [Planctomycetota bacterium]